MTGSVIGSWKCPVCGYVHEGSGPPAVCPVCGAEAALFQPGPAASSIAAGDRPEETPAAASGPLRIVVAGGGIAGLSAAEAARQSHRDATITLISRETRLPYYRLSLTRYLAGEVELDGLPVHPESWYHEQGIRLIRGVEVASIDPEGGTVALSDGGREPFDRLVLAPGARPIVPRIAGSHLDGVVTFRTVDDAERLRCAALGRARCLCLGGGILGLETAGAMARRGAEVGVLCSSPWLMPRQLNRRAGEILLGHIASLGVRVHLGVEAARIEGEARVTGVRLDDGSVLEADTVVLSVGVQPDLELARAAGLALNRGVVVDDHLRTSLPRILAAGDVAEHRGVVYGIWPASQTEGAIAGKNAAGLEVRFAGIARSNTLKVLGIDLFSVGTVEPDGAGFTIAEDEDGGSYRRFVVRDDRLVGAVVIGCPADASAAARAADGSVALPAAAVRSGRAAAIAEALRSTAR